MRRFIFALSNEFEGTTEIVEKAAETPFDAVVEILRGETPREEFIDSYKSQGFEPTLSKLYDDMCEIRLSDPYEIQVVGNDVKLVLVKVPS